MKGWAKKMIWFFGIGLFMTLKEYMYWLQARIPYEYDVSSGTMLLALIVFPLFFLKDDPEVQTRAKKRR